MASYKSLKSANAPAIPTGLIIPWSHNSIPNGFLVCGGQPVSRTTYADLFALIGKIMVTVMDPAHLICLV